MMDNKHSNLNPMYDSFHDKIQSCIVIKEKLQKNKKNLQPFFNQELKELKKQTDQKRKKFLKTRKENDEIAFKKHRKQYNFLLEEAKQNYYKNQIKQAGKNSKEIWRIINSLLVRKNSEKNQDQRKDITFNGVEKNNCKEIANIFSKYYQTAATDRLAGLTSKTNFRAYLQPQDKRNNTFKLEEIDNYQTWKLINTLSSKTSSGVDSICPKLIKACANTLAPPLTQIVNKCFSSGSFPRKLKTAKIIPLHKKNEREPINFRPISNLPTFSKIIEKACEFQFTNYFENTFDDKFQFAYK